MRLEEQLSTVVTERVIRTPQPVPDLGGAVRRGRSLRRRRVGAVAAAGVVGALVMVLTVTQLSDQLTPRPESFGPVGQLDYSEGLRAFASPDPDGVISLGGRTFPQEDMGRLDTDATTTPYGVVFFDAASQAHLLAEDGTDTVLAPPPTGGADFRASAKADARLPLVAFGQPTDDGVTIVLVDPRSGRTVDRQTVPCSGGACEDVVVDGLDRGLVFVRTGRGTYVWDPEAADERRWTFLGDGAFRVADARNGRVLWSGAPPSPAADSPVVDWAFTEGAIDAQLSYDGRHVLSWSATLEPTEPAGSAIRLKVQDAIWFTFDTDGSVLAAANGGAMRSVVHDCELPSGRCERIGSISTRSGDPVFIGNDM